MISSKDEKKEEVPLSDILPPEDPVPLAEWRANLLDGNNQKPKAALEPKAAVAMIEKAIAALSDETNKETLIGVYKNPEYADNPVRRAHKFELTLSKILKVAFAEFGITVGVDAKRALNQLSLEMYTNDDVKAAMDKWTETYKLIDAERGPAEAPKPAADEASAPAVAAS